MRKPYSEKRMQEGLNTGDMHGMANCPEEVKGGKWGRGAHDGQNKGEMVWRLVVVPREKRVIGLWMDRTDQGRGGIFNGARWHERKKTKKE